MHIFNVGSEINYALFQSPHILLGKISLLNASVILECLDRSDKHHAIRSKSTVTALDIEKLLSTEVRTETCLCYAVITEFECKFCRTK